MANRRSFHYRAGHQQHDSHEAAKVTDVFLESLHPIEACKWVCKEAIVCVGHHVPCKGIMIIPMPAVPSYVSRTTAASRSAFRAICWVLASQILGVLDGKMHLLPCPLTK